MTGHVHVWQSQDYVINTRQSCECGRVRWVEKTAQPVPASKEQT